MSKSPSAVTGAELRTGDAGALDAPLNFCRTPGGRDLGGPAANWAEDDMRSMDEPLPGISGRPPR
jgi:hypothetical protein